MTRNKDEKKKRRKKEGKKKDLFRQCAEHMVHDTIDDTLYIHTFKH